MIINGSDKFFSSSVSSGGELNKWINKKIENKLKTKGFDFFISNVSEEYSLSEEVKKMRWIQCHNFSFSFMMI
ncbi:MAG: hypothetical protein K2N40_02400 [Ureaplasma sp.]|nr:hypothetical protein [Ureaplasma sp.]